ncbi:helix-turn-helix domain-containing protein [Azospirillum sp. SYSU D00513]|uniref:helix-turn-helix domain-containing protein n=1 Tax=Azospirillum sp. SYSU D00513 TaxID=2812561 RepID=UPI001A95C109|nr:helix-turn-helix domain-containing protein [Azospirillum sp. SYSU D00513]
MPRISLNDAPALTAEQLARIDATTEEDIQRHIREDDSVELADVDPTELRVVRPYPDPRELRKRLKMTQEEFARTFGLSVWTLRDWEQHRAEPEGPSRILLRVIEIDPEVARKAAAA